MEYIIVSLFGTAVTLATLGYLGNIMREKLADVASRLGVDPPEIDFLPFGND